jgi:splicing factor 1
MANNNESAMIIENPAMIIENPEAPQGNGQDNEKADVSPAKEKKSNGFFFQDTVKIGDETLFTIPVENIFFEENKPKRKSRWGDAVDRKAKKVVQDVIFNPYQALGGPVILPITGPTPTPGPNEKSTKWGPEYEKTFTPPMFNTAARGLSIDDVELLMRLYRLDEIDRNLAIGELETGDPDCRSPSPDPTYDRSGVRTNTRENRAREKLLREKNDLIEECMKLKKTFYPPADYRAPKKNKKIFLPEGEMSEHNYIGMILGPRGVTQKQLEQKTGCKISVRGKGSSKQKRMEYDSEERLHILIQADTDESLEKGSSLVEKMLRGDTEGEGNEIKKNQLMQLAAIQGTLRDDWCDNCGEKGHRVWACPNKAPSWKKIEIFCAICKDKSHPTSDCPQRKLAPDGANVIQEFSKLMNLVGDKGGSTTASQGTGTNFITGYGKNVLSLTNGQNTFNGGNSMAPSAMNQLVPSHGYTPNQPTNTPMSAYALPQTFKQPQQNQPMAPNPTHILSTYSNNPYLSQVLPQHLFNPNYQATAVTITTVTDDTQSPFSSTAPKNSIFNMNFSHPGTIPTISTPAPKQVISTPVPLLLPSSTSANPPASVTGLPTFNSANPLPTFNTAGGNLNIPPPKIAPPPGFVGKS